MLTYNLLLSEIDIRSYLSKKEQVCFDDVFKIKDILIKMRGYRWLT